MTKETLISKSEYDPKSSRRMRDMRENEWWSLFKKEGDLSADIDKLKLDLVSAQGHLDRATPGDTLRGLNSVSIIIEANRIGGVFGPILGLMDCYEDFYTAVEIAAGNSLFHVVVEIDEISTNIIRMLTSDKGGRVTFIPRYKLNFKSVDAPAFNHVSYASVIHIN